MLKTAVFVRHSGLCALALVAVGLSIFVYILILFWEMQIIWSLSCVWCCNFTWWGDSQRQKRHMRHIPMFIYIHVVMQVDCWIMHAYKYVEVVVPVHLYSAVWLHVDKHNVGQGSLRLANRMEWGVLWEWRKCVVFSVSIMCMNIH